MFSLVIKEFASWLDTVIYTGLVYVASFLPYQVETFILKSLFTVETIGAQESSECIFLLSHYTPVNRKLLFSEKRQYVTSSIQQALEWEKEFDLPIQTVMCYRSRDYFVDGWVIPRPYELVYQFGEVGTKSIVDYQQEFLLSDARAGYRLYTPPDQEHVAILVAALLCSRFPVMMLYLLLRYQWYQGNCFKGLLTAAIIVEIGLSMLL